MANLQFQLEGNAAQLYEKYSVPMGAKPAAERLLDNIRLTSSDSVLDAACGTGIVTRLIAARSQPVASIVGVDLNDNMLDVARSLEPSTGFPIEWRQGDLCALSFSDAEFDVVLCNHGFQFFPDKAVALNEIKRVLVPGGRFAFTVCLFGAILVSRWGNHPKGPRRCRVSMHRHARGGIHQAFAGDGERRVGAGRPVCFRPRCECSRGGRASSNSTGGM